MEHDEDPEFYHPPLSPAGGAESLFLAGLATSHISANAIASQLRTTRGSSSINGGSMASADEFLTCVSSFDYDIESLPSSTEDDYLNNTKTIPELDSETDEEEETYNNNNKMAAKSKVSKATPTPLPPKPVLATATTTSSSTTTTPNAKPDAATSVYEGAKGVWAWGKGVPVFSPFMGAAEVVAGKALEVAGTNLEDVDGNLIKPQLTNLDTAILNPAIEAVVGIVLGTAGKTEEIFQQIISSLMAPFSKMITEQDEETPEVTK